jgi:hypothetical protein
LEVFAAHGFAALRQPILRRTVARTVTVEQAARRHGVDLPKLLSSLNRAVNKKVPLVVLS